MLNPEIIKAKKLLGLQDWNVIRTVQGWIAPVRIRLGINNIHSRKNK